MQLFLDTVSAQSISKFLIWKHTFIFECAVYINILTSLEFSHLSLFWRWTAPNKMSHFVRFYITIPEKKLKTPSILNEVFIKESVLIRSCIIGRKKKNFHTRCLVASQKSLLAQISNLWWNILAYLELHASSTWIIKLWK